MKLRLIVFAAALCIAGPALAQKTGGNLPAAPVARHKPPVNAPTARPQDIPAPASTGKVDPVKEAAIRHLMDITQTSKLGDNMAAYISSQVRRYMSQSLDPQTLPKFMDAFNQKFAASAPAKNVTDAMVPIYDRAFTKEQIDGLVQFYESPLGQHVVKVLPQVLEESQDAAEKMDQDAALNVLRGMSNDYPQLKRILPGENQPAPQEGAPSTQQPTLAPQAASPPQR